MGAIRRVVVALLVTSLFAVAVVAGLAVLYAYQKKPLPLADQCTAHVADLTVPISPEQAHYASIIVGVATQRGLAPRASTIALATVYQESGMLNIDYGDRDSLGLFQQRPSQGWGTEEQVQEPYYASGKFYDALVKVPNWRSGDVNDVAQAVQRSGHPKGYVRHVENARRLASALTGETPASFTCLVKAPPPGDPSGLAEFLERTLPESSTVSRTGTTVTVKAADSELAWSAAHLAVANHARYGLGRVEVGGRHWTASTTSFAPWLGETTDATTVTITFDNAPTPTAKR